MNTLNAGKFIVTNDLHTIDELKKHGSFVLNQTQEYKIFANVFDKNELAVFKNDKEMKYAFTDKLFL